MHQDSQHCTTQSSQRAITSNSLFRRREKKYRMSVGGFGFVMVGHLSLPINPAICARSVSYKEWVPVRWWENTFQERNAVVVHCFLSLGVARLFLLFLCLFVGSFEARDSWCLGAVEKWETKLAGRNELGIYTFAGKRRFKILDLGRDCHTPV